MRLSKGTGNRVLDGVRGVPLTIPIPTTFPIPTTLKKSRLIPKRFKFQGLNISIENPAGSMRHGTDQDGHDWSSMLHFDYGYIRNTMGVDGDQVDCFIGPNKDSTKVFVIHQRNTKTGAFDEDKCMLGWLTKADAKRDYLLNYDRSDQYMGMTVMPVEEFKTKAMGPRSKPMMIKSKIKAHMRRTSGGRVVPVREHEDIRQSGKEKYSLHRNRYVVTLAGDRGIKIYNSLKQMQAMHPHAVPTKKEEKRQYNLTDQGKKEKQERLVATLERDESAAAREQKIRDKLQPNPSSRLWGAKTIKNHLLKITTALDSAKIEYRVSGFGHDISDASTYIHVRGKVIRISNHLPPLDKMGRIRGGYYTSSMTGESGIHDAADYYLLPGGKYSVQQIIDKVVPKKSLMIKSKIKAHTRKLKSGKVARVKEHHDIRGDKFTWEKQHEKSVAAEGKYIDWLQTQPEALKEADQLAVEAKRAHGIPKKSKAPGYDANITKASAQAKREFQSRWTSLYARRDKSPKAAPYVNMRRIGFARVTRSKTIDGVGYEFWEGESGYALRAKDETGNIVHFTIYPKRLRAKALSEYESTLRMLS